MKSSVLYFFFTILKFLFNSTPSYINKSFEVIKIFLKKNFKLDLKQRFYLSLIFVLILAKVNIPIKKKEITNELWFDSIVLVVLK